MTTIETGPAVDSPEFFEDLAKQMNAQPDRYVPLGFCDIDLGVVMHRSGADDFRVLLRFAEYGCEAVEPFPESLEHEASCTLEGDLETFAGMVADIRANGRATARYTLSSLVLLGDRVRLVGADPMGVDRFFRYAETIQNFFDGAAPPVTKGAR